MIDLKKILQKYPESIQDQVRFQATVKDLYPGLENGADIFLITAAYNIGIVPEIISNELDDFFISRLKQRLVNRYSMQAEKADYAVRLWCYAYGAGILNKKILFKQNDNDVHIKFESETESDESLNQNSKNAAETPSVQNRIEVKVATDDGAVDTLSERAIYLLQDELPPNKRILVLCHSKKIVSDIGGRLKANHGPDLSRVWIETFHACGLQIIKSHYDRLGFKEGFGVLDNAAKDKIVLSILQSCNLSENKLQDFSQKISLVKKGLSPYDDSIKGVINAYNAARKAANMIDFDDMIGLAVKLVTKYPDIAEEYHSLFSDVLVDQAQQVFGYQAQLPMLIAGNKVNLFIVSREQINQEGQAEEGNGTRERNLIHSKGTLTVAASNPIKKYDKDGYDARGYDKDGFDRDGYNRKGYDRQGFPRPSVPLPKPKKVYDSEGYDAQGYDRDGYNRLGYDYFGYDRDGYNRAGYDREGYNRAGFNRNGFDKSGYNRAGFNDLGIHRETGSRFAPDGYNQYGFDKDGYDKLGFDSDGYNRSGYDRSGYNREGFDQLGFDRNGYDRDGYDKDGYGADGYNRSGYDREGFNQFGRDQSGYDRAGFNESGIHRETGTPFDKNGYNQQGYDQDGYDRKGYNAEGYNRAGYNRYGFDKDGFDLTGFDRDGYDRQGYNHAGYDRDGYRKNGFNKKGYDREGYDRQGFDKFGYDRDGYYRDGYNISGYDREGYNREGFAKDGYNREGYDRYGYDRNGYDREGYDHHGFDRKGIHKETHTSFGPNGYDREGYDREGYDRSGLNRSGLDRNGYDHAGFDAEGFNASGYNAAGYNKDGYDKVGYDQFGYDRKGYDRQGFDHTGRDQQGYDRDGYNSEGYDREGYDREGFNSAGQHRDGYHKNDSPEVIEPIQEKKYFENTEAQAHALLLSAEAELGQHGETAPLGYYESNPDEFDAYEYQRENTKFQFLNQQLEQDVRTWEQSCQQPYFAKIDYKGYRNLYIGRHRIPDFVLDWADQACKVYYDYQIYIGNPEFDLTLVRDFDIQNGEYHGYSDKYRRGISDKSASGQTVDSIADERLAQVIETYKASKKVHDIIATIQANQYQIITQDKSAILTVCGCAGSGKTMIMFHRLRYLLYNNPNLRAECTFLISPIDLLLQASDELSQTLQLTNANHFTTNQFYEYAIAAYIKAQELPAWQVGTEESNYGLSNDIVEGLYSYGSCQDFQGSVAALFDPAQQDIFDQFIEKEVKTLHKKLVDFGCESGTSLETLLVEGDVFNKENLQQYDGALEELGSFSQVNARAMLADERKRYKAGNDYLAYLIENGVFRGSTKYKAEEDKDKKQIPISGYSELNCLRFLFGDMGKGKKSLPLWKDNHLIEKYSHGGKYRDPLELFAAYKKLSNKVGRLQKFAKLKDKSYLLDIIVSKIQDIKHKLSIPEEKTYEWETFYTCLGLQAVCGGVDFETRYVFMDEFQDLAPTELSCIKAMFPAAVLNLFGDPHQCISPKGIQDSADIPFQTHKYELQENYRNALEITEFVNQTFEMHMLPIGIHGSVCYGSSVQVSESELESGDRIAVIYKERAALSRYGITEDQPMFSFLNMQESELTPQKVNILPIFQAKGMEFEKVFVVCDGMSENERYVAMTRALNNLVILEEESEDGNASAGQENSEDADEPDGKSIDQPDKKKEGLFARIKTKLNL